MTGGKAYADFVAVRARSALARRTSQTDVFAIGPLTFRLTGPSGAPSDWMGRAFVTDAGARDADIAHHVMVWDGTSPDDVHPSVPWAIEDTLPLGLVASHSDDMVRCAVDIHTDSLFVTDFGEGHTCTWYRAIPELPAWAKASPFRIPLSWLCNRHRMQIVHGAAVGIDGQAVLLLGNGGSGKSTTALACALAGFDYLGDDYCAIEPAAGKVHMVYRTAKMFKTTLALLPSIEGQVENRARIEQEKGVTFLDPHRIKLTRSANLSAILLPRVGDGATPTIYPASRADVMKAVLPSTIGGLMGGTAATPGLLMELVRSVPAYHLVLAPDMGAVVDAVALKSRLAA